MVFRKTREERRFQVNELRFAEPAISKCSSRQHSGIFTEGSTLHILASAVVN